MFGYVPPINTDDKYMSDDFAMVIQSATAVKTVSTVIGPVIDKSCTGFPLEGYSQTIMALTDSLIIKLALSIITTSP